MKGDGLQPRAREGSASSQTLAERLRQVADAVKRATMRFARFSALLAAGALAYVALGAIAEGLPPVVAVPALIVWALPIGFLVWRLSSAPYATVLPWLRFGRLQPFFFVVAVWLGSVGWFSAVAVVLNEHAGAEFVTRWGDTSPYYGRYADFFGWHFAEQVPLLKVNETLHWDVPLTYESGAGWVLLAFRLLVLVPLAQVALPAARSAAQGSLTPAAAADPPPPGHPAG